jgi:endonuclease/exonuclease/phosphatase family metal-dependent hydrolase
MNDVPISRHVSIGRILFVAVAMTPIGLAGLSCIVQPDSLAALTLVPPWFWVLAGLPGLAWAIRTRRRRWAGALALVWLAFSVAYVEQVAALTRTVAQYFRTIAPASIRIVSLNVANTAQCIEDLQAVRPDIVLIQEIPSHEELQKLAQALFGDDGQVLAGNDTAILARGSIEPQLFPGRTSLVSGIVMLPGQRPIHCVSVRRTPPVSRLDGWTLGFWTEHRARRVTHRMEAQEIRQALDAVESNIPQIAGGDLNAPPHHPTLKTLRPAVQDAFLIGGVGLGGTGTNDFPLFRVDQICVSGRPLRVFSQKTKHSDHRMVVCDLAIPE